MTQFYFDPTNSRVFFYQRWYAAYESLNGKLVRFAIWIVLAIILFLQISGGSNPSQILGVIALVLMHELYWQFYIDTRKSSFTLHKSNLVEKVNVANVISIEVVKILVRSSKTQFLVSELLKRPEVRFMIAKLHLEIDQSVYAQLPLNDVIQRATAIALTEGREKVTPVDFFASLLLMKEEETKTLFQARIKEEELLSCALWALGRTPGSWNPKDEVLYIGIGFAQNFLYTWGLELSKYTRDLTREVIYKPQMLVGREEEVKTIEALLSKQENTNILLVGDPGIGKEAIVRALALKLYTGRSNVKLNYKRVIQMEAGMLLAGVSNTGEVNERINDLMADLVSDEQIILYIPNINDLFEGSQKSAVIKALSPYFQNNKIQLITTCLPEDFKSTIDRDQFIKDQFQVINLNEPSKEQALEILEEAADKLEASTRVSITFLALKELVDLSDKFMYEKVLPGKALDVLDQAFSRASAEGLKEITEVLIRHVITEITKIPTGKPSDQEKSLLMNLEKELQSRVIGQDEALVALANAIRTSRTELGNSQKPMGVFLFLGPTGVGKTETAKALAQVYFKSVDNMVRIDMSEFQSIEAISRLLGTQEHPGLLTEKIRENPYSLVLLDEFEKAHPNILDLFLQVFDDGRLTDGKGRLIHFTNTIIIATSNAGAELVRTKLKQGTEVGEFREELLGYLQENHIFKPELLNRFDGIIMYKPLNQAQLQEITKMNLQSLKSQLDQQDIKLDIDPMAMLHIVTSGYDPVYGARPLRRFIKDHLESEISRLILDNTVQRGQTIHVSMSQSGKMQFDVT